MRTPPLAALALLVALPAAAQETGQSAPSSGTTEPAPICTDRPTKSNFACTVPDGAVQIETDLVNWTSLSVGGARTDTVLYTNPTLKLGIGSHTDFEANIAPYATVRSRDAAGNVDTLGGVGDLYLRLKQRLTTDDAKTQVAIIPYIKAPTAKIGIGNGEWEGGAILAANIPLPRNFTLTVGPEVDILADAAGSGHHASLTMVANLSHPIGKRVTVYGEFWTAQNFDPAGDIRQYSLDAAIAYLISPKWQVDLGSNFGLNRATPGSQVYLGLSTRF